MNLIAQPLEGRFVRLEPFEPRLKEEVRAALHCDPETWAIMASNLSGDRFDEYWAAACGASLNDRIAYAIRWRPGNRIIGISSLYTGSASQGGVEIGTSFLRPETRGGPANPEAKLLLLSAAFAAGAVRVQFRVDTRNVRSQAAVTKLGAVREGVLRCDRVTWTGYLRDTAYFSILDREWPDVKARLEQRLAALSTSD